MDSSGNGGGSSPRTVSPRAGRKVKGRTPDGRKREKQRVSRTQRSDERDSTSVSDSRYSKQRKSKEIKKQPVPLRLDGEKRLLPGTIITVSLLQVTVVRLIGSGGFGNVYLVRDVNGTKYAMKTEYRLQGSSSRMKTEVKTYDKIMKFRAKNPELALHLLGFFGSGAIGEMKFLVMTRVGYAIEDLLAKYEIRWPTALRMFTQMFDGIAELHRIGFVHRDIKPANFAVGLNEQRSRIFIIDLGTSINAIDDSSKLPTNSRYGFLGTLLYAPRASHVAAVQTKKDDLESWIYMCWDVMAPQDVPWSKETDKDKVHSMKQQFIANPGAFMKTPTQFIDILEMVKALEPCVVPDYVAMRKLLETLGEEEDVDVDGEVPFDWEKEENRVAAEVQQRDPARSYLRERKGGNKKRKKADC